MYLIIGIIITNNNLIIIKNLIIFSFLASLFMT